MNVPLSLVAALVSVVALYLPTRSQTFTRVTVDGHGIRMLIAGGGDATVVFENGLGGSLESWGKVQPAVARFATTVTYDRAGSGLSDTGPSPRDGDHTATELRHALRAAGIAPPYILVGASLGGPYIRVFADRYAEDVSAMVLVDPTPDSARAEGLVPETRALPETLAQARAGRIPIGIPVFLIDAVWQPEVPFATATIRMQRMANRTAIAAESREYRQWLDTIPGSRLIVTDRSGHNIAQEQPDLVVSTVQEAIRAARPSSTNTVLYR